MNTTKITLALLALLCATAFAQQKGTFTDARDKKKYKTVKIGEQTWMAENLDYAHESSVCYDNKPANCTKYGRLYDVYHSSIVSVGYLCPDGWRFPGSRDWETLMTLAGGREVAGKALKAKSGWNNHEGKSGNGTDKFGFAVLPGGCFADDKFIKIGEVGTWWYSGAEYFPEGISNSGDVVGSGNTIGADCNIAAIRCIKASPEEAAAMAKARTEMEAQIKAKAEEKAKAEAEAKAKAEAIEAKAKADSIAREERIKTNSGSFTDSRDKRTYKTIKIGTQTWMAENLDYADKDSKCYDNKPENCKKYGRLYNWATAAKACPEDWHLPTKNEWTTLVNRVGEGFAAFDLKSKSGWRGDNNNGTDQYGFAALPGGFYFNNAFKHVEEYGYWWSATEKDASKALINTMSSLSKVLSGESDKNSLYSVRCLQGKGTQAAQPAAKPAAQQQSANENCNITFPKKACVSVPKNSCKLMGGKVVDKCP